jgi:hypothetical protein
MSILKKTMIVWNFPIFLVREENQALRPYTNANYFLHIFNKNRKFISLLWFPKTRQIAKVLSDTGDRFGKDHQLGEKFVWLPDETCIYF